MRAADDMGVGFDGLAEAVRAIYDLTTVEQPYAAMAGRALDALQARIVDQNLPDETVSLRGRLLIRGSSGTLPCRPAP